MKNNKMQNNFINVFISSLIVLFSYGKVKDSLFRDKDQISSGEG